MMIIATRTIKVNSYSEFLCNYANSSQLASLPLEYIRLSTDIITYAKDSLELKLNQNVYLTLTRYPIRRL